MGRPRDREESEEFKRSLDRHVTGTLLVGLVVGVVAYFVVPDAAFVVIVGSVVASLAFVPMHRAMTPPSRRYASRQSSLASGRPGGHSPGLFPRRLNRELAGAGLSRGARAFYWLWFSLTVLLVPLGMIMMVAGQGTRTAGLVCLVVGVVQWAVPITPLLLRHSSRVTDRA